MNKTDCICKYSRIYLIIVIVILMINLNLSHAQVFQEKKAAIKEIGCEFIGATIGEIGFTLVGAAASFVLMRNISNTQTTDSDPTYGAIILLMGGGVIGGAVGAPLGTVIVGNKNERNGSTLGAYIGGITGVAITSLLIYGLFNTPEHSTYHQIFGYKTLIPVAFLSPPILSVTGYNLLPSKKSSLTSMIEKCAPQCAITVLPHKYNNKIMPVIGLKMTMGF